MDLKEYRNGHIDIYGTFNKKIGLYLNIKKEQPGHSAKHLLLCCTKERKELD